ncbi:MAG: hypothetical protein QXD97_06265 [Acidilobaceae archaeon]
MLIYGIPELYKALTLTYEKAKTEESWRIAYERINHLVTTIEKLKFKSNTIGVDIDVYFKDIGRHILKSIEEDNISKVMTSYEIAIGVIKQIEPRINAYNTYLILSRPAVTIIVLLSALQLTLEALKLNSIITLTQLIIAIGVTLGSFLLIQNRHTHWALTLAVILQLLTLPTIIKTINYQTTIPLIIATILVSLLIIATHTIKNNIKEHLKAITPKTFNLF